MVVMMDGSDEVNVVLKGTSDDETIGIMGDGEGGEGESWVRSGEGCDHG